MTDHEIVQTEWPIAIGVVSACVIVILGLLLWSWIDYKINR